MGQQVQAIQEGRTAAYSITGTSPSSVTTAVVGSAVTGLGIFRSLEIYATIQGATGGTLNLYLQTSPNQGTNWVDYIAFTLLGIAASAVTLAINVSSEQQSSAAASAAAAVAPSIVSVGTGLNPSLTAGTVIGGEFGDRMRLVATANTGTTLGATQTIKIVGKS